MPTRCEHWLDEYLKRLDDAPRPADRITGQTWREALGEYRRVADWEVYFRDAAGRGAVAGRARPLVAAAGAGDSGRRHARRHPHLARGPQPRGRRGRRRRAPRSGGTNWPAASPTGRPATWSSPAPRGPAGGWTWPAR